jgi:hypothetical protein
LSLSNDTTEVGPLVTSHDRGTLNTATFDHVDVWIAPASHRCKIFD